MGKSLGFVYGVPIGIAVGVLAGASLEIHNFNHSAAKGVLIGALSGLFLGVGAGAWAAHRKYKWVQSELPVASDAEWLAVVRTLNITAADQHYLLLRREEDYVAYAPTLARPVAAGPLTVSGEYLTVVVARSDDTTILITGPQYIVDDFERAIETGPKGGATTTQWSPAAWT